MIETNFKLTNIWEPDRWALNWSYWNESEYQAIAPYFNKQGEYLKSTLRESVAGLLECCKNGWFLGEFDGYTDAEFQAISAGLLTSFDAFVMKVLAAAEAADVRPAKNGANTDLNKRHEALLADAAKCKKDFNDFNKKVNWEKLRKDHSLKRRFNELRSLETAANKRVEMFRYDMPKMLKILKSLHIEASKSVTTAVKGYHLHLDGYQASPGYVRLRGSAVKQFKSLINEMKSNGIAISKLEMPEYNLGSGHTAGIKFEPII
jgi:hypothetical protein